MIRRTISKGLILFTLQAAVYGVVVMGIVMGINAKIDGSSVITAKSHADMARLSLSGEVVAAPENYNERVYQVAVVDEMKAIPETVVVGSSRGMFLGEEITAYDAIYNNCVSGGGIYDYYALIGLYQRKYGCIPPRIIIETSPWVFFENNPENRWLENYRYRTSCLDFYKVINGKEKEIPSEKRENPYLSMAYFQYNRDILMENGMEAFAERKARVSDNNDEAADYSDGTIRYAVALEQRSEERLEKVRATNAGVTYQSVNNMTELSENKIAEYENLISYCQRQGTEVIIYMQPFSPTQCKYIYDEKTNLIFEDVEDYLIDVGLRYGIKVVGGYDARRFFLSDEAFIDYMHLDRSGTDSVWNFN